MNIPQLQAQVSSQGRFERAKFVQDDQRNSTEFNRMQLVDLEEDRVRRKRGVFVLVAALLESSRRTLGELLLGGFGEFERPLCSPDCSSDC